MTSAQLRQPGRRRPLASALGLLSLAATGAAGCQAGRAMPALLTAPFQEHQTWAVAPFANESGVSDVDVHHVADLFTQEAQQVVGVDTIPVNRVILAMREIGMSRVTSPNDAAVLMNLLDVDALIVGTITAYEAYPPLRLGAAVELHCRQAFDRIHTIDSVALTRSVVGLPAPGQLGPPVPTAQAAGLFDGRNEQTRAWLDAYATGRSDPETAYGSEIYLVSMELYTQFVGHRLIGQLLRQEQRRLTPMAGANPMR